MSVQNGQNADANTFNNAFTSKTEDSIITGVVSLANLETESGEPIDNVQKAINDLASGTEALEAEVVKTSGDQTVGGEKVFTSTPTVPKLDLVQGDIIGNPASGSIRIGVKNNGRAYVRDALGNEKEVGSGSGGGLQNYVTNSKAETNTLGYNRYKDAAGAEPVDGTGGVPSAGLTFARNTTNPIYGGADFLLSKDANNYQGEGVNYEDLAFVIDQGDRYKSLIVEFDYKVASGTYATGDQQVFLYDIGNLKLIRPSYGQSIANHLLPSMKHTAQFQLSDSTAYRIVWHTATTSALAYSLQFTNVRFGAPQPAARGDLVIDEFVYNSSGITAANTSNTTSFATGEDGVAIGSIVSNSASSGYWTAFGVQFSDATRPTDEITLEFRNPNSSLQWTPAGSIADISPFTFQSSARLGAGVYVTGDRTASVYFGNAGRVNAGAYGSAGDAWSNLSTWRWRVRRRRVVKNTVLSTENSGRRLYAKAWSNSVLTIANGGAQQLPFTGGDNSSGMIVGNEIVIPENGDYRLTGSTGSVGGATYRLISTIKLVRNGVTSDLVITRGATNPQGHSSVLAIDTLPLLAGDRLQLWTAQESGASRNTTGDISTQYLTVERAISGSQTIAQAEPVRVDYSTSAGQSIPNSTHTTVSFGTKIEDTHGAWNGTTFTAPISGRYLLNASIFFNSSGTGIRGLYYAKNGGIAAALNYNPVVNGYTAMVTGSRTVILKQGETIHFSAYHTNGSALSLSIGGGENWIEIQRIG